MRGLRPSEAARCDTTKVPKPAMRTSSPLFSALVMAFDHGVDCLGRVGLGHITRRGNGIDKIVLIHGQAPLFRFRDRRRVNGRGV